MRVSWKWLLGFLGLVTTVTATFVFLYCILSIWFGWCDAWSVDKTDLWEMVEPWYIGIMLVFSLIGLWQYYKFPQHL